MYDPFLVQPLDARVDPKPPTKNKVLAVIALLLGIIAIIGSWIPFVSIASVIFGLAGIPVGVIGLVQATDGRAGGKGMSITGLTLSVLAIGVAVISTYIGLLLIAVFTHEHDDTGGDGAPIDGPELVEVEPLEIEDVQAWIDSEDIWNYFVLVNNPSDQAFYDDTLDKAVIQLVSEDGIILASQSSYAVMPPGAKTALVGPGSDGL